MIQVPAASSLVALPKTVLKVAGRDAAKFLNGLLTVKPPASLDSAEPTGSFACMLNSKGRVVADLFVYNTGPSEYLLEVDSSITERIVRQLEFYRLASQVSFSETNLKSWYFWDDDATTPGVPANAASAASGADLAFPDFRVGELGTKILAESKPMDLELDTLDQYTVRRYLFGIAEGASELISAKTLPLEFNADFLNGVDFHKGCYVGQELTVRTKHHGVIRKRVVPVVFTAPGSQVPEQIYAPLKFEVEPQDAVMDASPVPEDASGPFASSAAAKSRPAGSVIAALGNIGLASMRIDRLGHKFHLKNGTAVHPMMPFWWPEDVSTN